MGVTRWKNSVEVSPFKGRKVRLVSTSSDCVDILFATPVVSGPCTRVVQIAIKSVTWTMLLHVLRTLVNNTWVKAVTCRKLTVQAQVEGVCQQAVSLSRVRRMNFAVLSLPLLLRRHAHTSVQISLPMRRYLDRLRPTPPDIRLRPAAIVAPAIASPVKLSTPIDRLFLSSIPVQVSLSIHASVEVGDYPLFPSVKPAIAESCCKTTAPQARELALCKPHCLKSIVMFWQTHHGVSAPKAKESLRQ